MPSENESWLVEAGNRVIQKMAAGDTGLDPWEALVDALWWADYAMRNGESLSAVNERNRFHAKGRRVAKELSLRSTYDLFSLDLARFETEYLDRFEVVCREIRAAEPGPAAAFDVRSDS